jgi:hypothetical protein
MSADEYNQLRTFWHSALDLIIHGKPKDNDESLNFWHEGAVQIHENFSKFLRENQPDECN